MLEQRTQNPHSFQDRRQAFQTFSTGPRNLIGQHLAWAEMRLVLSKLIWNLDMTAVENELIQWEDLRTFLLVGKRHVMVRLR